jgi:phenylalanyl-tRNA synthetase beta chain
MNVSKQWLNEFLPVEDMSALADEFSMHSQEVEVVRPLLAPVALVVGHVTQTVTHPDADKLSVCQVNIGKETLQIVCGAPNVAKGQKVIVATVGTVLPGLVIQEATIRGVTSKGMICSLPEIGLEAPFGDASGIEVLGDDAVIGSNPLEYLHLNDTVMELALTPNRGDLLSMMGVAYDVAAIRSTSITLPSINLRESSKTNPISISIDTPACMVYSARVLEDIVIQPSPAWLKARLIASGIRPINNVVDITNYIMMETGQPLHAFDLDKFGSEHVVVRFAKAGETIVTLDEIQRTLTKDDVVITNGKIATAIGGIKGGLHTGIDATTKRVLLESATFSPVHIRKTAQRLELRSEASSRFEKGVDPKRTALALDRAATLLQELAGANVFQGKAVAGEPPKADVHVVLSLSSIETSIGMPLSVSTVESLLRRLMFEVQTKHNVFTITIPSRRGDIHTTQDVVEELARLIGYDNIPSIVPVGVTKGGLKPHQRTRRRVRRLLSSLGLHETVTYSLIPEASASIALLTNDPWIKVQSPMSETKVVLRQRILPSLLEVVKYHHARQLQDVRLFEVSHVHNHANDEVVAGVLSGKAHSARWHQKDPVSFYDIKGLVERLLELLGATPTFAQGDVPELFHPGQSAVIHVDQQVIGYVGKVHPKWQKHYEIKDTFVFEILVSSLVQPTAIALVQPIPKIPGVTRELTFVVGLDALAADVVNAVHAASTKYLTSVQVYDVYTTSERSITLSLQFQDDTKTLSSESVQADVDSIVAYLTSKNIRFKDVTG